MSLFSSSLWLQTPGFWSNQGGDVGKVMCCPVVPIQQSRASLSPINWFPPTLSFTLGAQARRSIRYKDRAEQGAWQMLSLPVSKSNHVCLRWTGWKKDISPAVTHNHDEADFKNWNFLPIYNPNLDSCLFIYRYLRQSSLSGVYRQYATIHLWGWMTYFHQQICTSVNVRGIQPEPDQPDQATQSSCYIGRDFE